MSQLAQSPQLVTAIPQRRGRLATTVWWIVILHCIGVSVYATRYFVTTPADDHLSRYILPLRLHIAGRTGLVAGPGQFSEPLLKQKDL